MRSLLPHPGLIIPGAGSTCLPHQSEVWHQNFYPGIRPEYYENQQQSENDCIVAQGAGHGQIRLAIESVHRAGAAPADLDIDSVLTT